MEYFACEPQLGKLKIINVYLNFDGPKIFYAENETGTVYFVYWVGDGDGYQSWYVIPCSKSKLIAFEKRQLNLKSILENQEQEYFYDLKLPFSQDGKIFIELKHRNKISEIALPSDNVFVKKVSVYSPSLLENNLVTTHEVIVSKTNKNSKKNIFLEQMSLVCDKFSELVLGFNESLGIKGKIQALNARYGSFAISLHADELSKFELFLGRTSDLMINKKDILPFLKENNIDLKVFLNFLKAIESSSVDFELRSTAEPERIIKIYKLDAELYLVKLQKQSLSYIASIKVPQANDIHKVFTLLDLKWANDIVNAKSLNVEPRLVAYYRQAAKILGFMEYNGELTPQGQRVVLSDVETKYRITANAFEASECAWAWMSHYELTSLSKIDPNTSLSFLKERCLALSPKTAARRANTLTSWYNQLIPYYIDLESKTEMN